MAMTDGTLLSPAVGSTGDTIDNEVVAGNPAKVSRSKIALGTRNADLGDVGPANPMPVGILSYPPSTYYSAQAAVSGAAKASPGNLKSFKAINRNTGARYLQLFNLAAAPAGGAAAFDEWYLPPGPWMVVIGTDFFTDAGVAFSTGIAWGFSTTSGTYAAATAADHDFSAVVV